MAYRHNDSVIKPARDDDLDFTLIFTGSKAVPDNEVAPASGIYRCLGCGREIVMMRGDPFSFGSRDGHQVRWQLAVKPEPKDNHD